VVESQKELICRFKPDGELVFANTAFSRYYGIPYRDLIGRKFHPEIPVKEREKVLEHFASLTPEKPGNNIEHHIIMPDGSVRWQQWSDLAIFTDDGVLTEFQSVGRDITDQKEMEISLVENLNYSKTLMDTIPIPVFYRDTGGVYQDCNKAFEQLVGRSREEIIGKTISDFFPKEQADHFRYMDDLIIARPYNQQYEYSITNSRGEKIDAFFSKSAFLDANGEVKGIVGGIFDISERKIFERVVHESEEKYRTLAEYTHDWEAWLSPEGAYLYVSPSCERITGFSKDEFIADPGLVITITHPDDREMVQTHYSSISSSSDAIVHMDYRIITKEQEVRWISHFCQSVFRDDGTWIGRRENKRDITFRKQIEKALQEANLKLNLLSGITRHDILNQLTALVGYTDIARDMTDDAGLKDILGRIMEAASAINGQISFTRVYQDIGVYAPVWQFIPETITKASQGITIQSVVIDPSLQSAVVLADPLLEKVFYCLLENSVRHGKRVTIARFSCTVKDGVLILVYEDNGVGIIEENKEKIFERGFGSNTGYGLFLAREILAISGNSIRETGEYQKGARFEISFSRGSFKLAPGNKNPEASA
jgi:PAS domain S-box-containing protein